MTATDDAPSPSSHTAGSPTRDDDGWRPVESEEWQTRDVGNLVKDQQEAIGNEAVAQPDQKDRINGISPISTERSIQQAPTKLSFLTRPVPSHDDPSHGFSFTKAKPIQPLNLNRNAKPVQNVPGIHEAARPQGVLSNSRSPVQTLPTRASSDDGMERGIRSSEKTAVSWPDEDPVASTSARRRKSKNIPFRADEAAGSDPGQQGALRPNAPEPSSHLISTSATRKTSNKQTTTPVLSHQLAVPYPHVKATSARHSAALTSINGALPHGDSAPVEEPLPDSMPREQQPGAHSSKSNTKSSQTCSGLPNMTKVSKPPLKRRKRPAPARHNIIENPRLIDQFEEHDVLLLLQYKRQKAEREMEMLRAEKGAKEAEFENLFAKYKETYTMLEDSEQQKNEKEQQLSRIKAAKPALENKIRKLNDFVKGLSNDHNRLRDDASDIRAKQIDICEDKKELQGALQFLHESIGQERSRAKDVVIESCHQVHLLEQTIQNQRDQLHDAGQAHEAEQGRFDQLKSEMSRLSTSHGQLLESLTDQREIITKAIGSLLNKKIEICQTAPSPTSYDHVTPLLEQCIGMLQELGRVETVKPEDLQNLNASMNSCAENVTRVLDVCEQTCASSATIHQEFASNIQEQLRDLSKNVISEQPLSEQITNLREIKATVQERLHATDAVLKDTRFEILQLKGTEQQQARIITSLEIEAAKTKGRPVEAPQTLFRIHELECCNKDLQAQAQSLQNNVAHLSEQTHQKIKEATDLKQNLNRVQAQLDDSREENSRIRQEKTCFEAEAIKQREKMRTELSRAADSELEDAKSDHLNELEQLKGQRTATETRLERVLQDLAAERNTDSRHTDSLTEQQLQKEKEIYDMKAVVVQLRAKVAELERSTKEAEESRKVDQDIIASSKANIQAKERDNLRLQSSMVAKDSELRKMRSNPEDQYPRRSHHFTKQSPAVIKDCQPAELPKTVSLSEIMSGTGQASPMLDSNLSQDFTKQTSTAVEDSQPRGSIDAVNFHDPFLGYTQTRSPQRTQDTDMSGLFTHTPRPRDEDASHYLSIENFRSQSGIDEESQLQSKEVYAATQRRPPVTHSGLMKGHNSNRSSREFSTSQVPLVSGKHANASSQELSQGEKTSITVVSSKNRPLQTRKRSVDMSTTTDGSPVPSKRLRSVVPEASGSRIPGPQLGGRVRKFSTAPKKTTRDDSMKAYLREQRDLGETSSSGRMTVDKKSVPAC